LVVAWWVGRSTKFEVPTSGGHGDFKLEPLTSDQ
jgi:hypothetical protein